VLVRDVKIFVDNHHIDVLLSALGEPLLKQGEVEHVGQLAAAVRAVNRLGEVVR
jgi:hypothetical protein